MVGTTISHYKVIESSNQKESGNEDLFRNVYLSDYGTAICC